MLESLDSLLALIERHVDLEHCRHVDDRYRRALAWEETDRPPLVVQEPFGKTWHFPPPWDEFETFPYRRAFDDPAAMLQNALLSRVVPGLILRDDNPLAIRNDHGTIQVAAHLGASWSMSGDNYPWVKTLGSTAVVREFVDRGFQEVTCEGLIAQSTQTLAFFREQLSRYPKCAEAVQISLPDLQGPMDTAEQLWGSEILIALMEEPELVGALMEIIVQAMLSLDRRYRPLTHDRLSPSGCTQHGYNIPGRLLIRDDSSVLVSPETYRRVIGPHDGALLEQVGGGSIHFCGNGSQLIEPMLELPSVRGLDFGEPGKMDVAGIYARCRERRVVLTGLRPAREDLLSGSAVRDFPTGVVFVYETTDVEDAREVVEACRRERGVIRGCAKVTPSLCIKPEGPT